MNQQWPTPYSVTSAPTDLVVANNGSWSDAFQFGTPGDTSWSLVGTTFELEVKTSRYSTTPSLTLSVANGRILILDPIARVIAFNVTPTDLQTSLSPGYYVYDLVMIEGLIADPTATRVLLMHGKLQIVQGVTEV